MEAPSLASIAQIGLSVAACALGSPFASIALNMVDDVVTVSQGLIEGTMTWDEAGVNMLRGTASAVAGAYVSDAFGAATAGIENTFGGAVLKTVMGVGSMASKNLVTGSIEAIKYSAGGNFDYDGDYLKNALIGEQALVGYLGGAAATFVTESMGAFTIGEAVPDEYGNIKGYQTVWGFSKERIGWMQTLNSTMGNIAQMGVEFAMTGESTVNLLNFRDIAQLFKMDWFRVKNFNEETGSWEGTDNWHSVGMLEMNISEDGLNFSLGTGGIDMSVGRIVDSIRGIESNVLNARIMGAAGEGVSDNTLKEERAAILRGGLDFGDEKSKEQVWNVLNKKDELYVGDDVKAGAYGYTIADKLGGGRKISIKSGGDNRFAWLANSVVFQHEAYRDGYATADNEAETEQAVIAHTMMALRMTDEYGLSMLAGSENLQNDVKAYLEDPEGFGDYVRENYGSSEDYWKLTKDGALVYDGSADLWDETGKEKLLETGVPDDWVETGLLKILGLDDCEMNRRYVTSLMEDAGLEHTAGAHHSSWDWNDGDLDNINIGKRIEFKNSNNFYATRLYYNRLDEYNNSMHSSYNYILDLQQIVNGKIEEAKAINIKENNKENSNNWWYRAIGLTYKESEESITNDYSITFSHEDYLSSKYIKDIAKVYKMPLKPKNQIDLSSTILYSDEWLMGNLHNKYGNLVTQLSNGMGISYALGLSVEALESAGGIYIKSGKPIIRVENHSVWDFWGYKPENREIYNKYLKVENGLHYYREDENSEWKLNPHGGANPEGQKIEWEVYNLITDIYGTEEPAALGTSFGAGQVMGFNYWKLGYSSATEMANAFVRSERLQVIGMFDCIKNNEDSQAMINSLNDANGNYGIFVERYNGAYREIEDKATKKKYPNPANIQYQDDLRRFLNAYLNLLRRISQ